MMGTPLTDKEEVQRKLQDMTAAKAVVKEVVAERMQQRQKWGLQAHSPLAWLAVLMEEVGEVAECMAEAHANDGAATREWQEAKHAHARDELVQVAAVAVAMVEAYDVNWGKV